MSLTNLPDFLTSDTYGEIFLKGHRVTLYHVLWHYNNGYSPEALHEQFPTISMGLIHQVLSYYWNQMDEVNQYLGKMQAEIDQQGSASVPIDFDALRQRLTQKLSTKLSSYYANHVAIYM
ncbi:MAG: DUF433 domain-containing protein [Gemmatales bacterium]